ncbi:sulfite reductase (ferredoxin) [Natranaerovirga pectinivora]|uniref:Sulfite reductase (Ferredoxin) n=1 Tax=Natranaerovirga pectinivora TaxID=682400 RepID=A0A4R3MMH6_9FIRM|nr:sulfurtransferase TusA family protein [Natranaerovirga pectinivora]TCT14237.1 sulfite reductase (ferredoxin) [Natranaerovirga pectinivora]
MIKIPERVINEIKEYPVKLKEFKAGIIEPDRFKPYRVSMGIYEQRDNNTFMIRTRIPSGVITLEQFKKITELADIHSHGHVHLTTRQDVQFHKVSLEGTEAIMMGLLDVGIMTRGTGGNTARNVVASALSGVSKEEPFDVTLDALATTEFLLTEPSAFNLPRKYKIGFSISKADDANATVSDLGFIAKEKDGQLGYELYGAGGLGGRSTTALKLDEFIPRSEILYHVLAMKNIFEKEGDRTNKHSARIRFIVYRLGEEEFRRRYNEELEIVKKEYKLDLDLPLEVSSAAPNNNAASKSNNIVAQRQEGLYALYIHPQNGNITVKNINKILDFLSNLAYETTIRLTNTQGLYVRDLKEEDVSKLDEITKEFSSPFVLDHSVACAGAATCKLGLCLSQNLLDAIVEKFETVEESIKSLLPQIFISGCPNSCGQHQKGKIGLAGKAKRTEKGLVPHYTLFLNGNFGENAELGKASGDIPTKKIPDFLYEIGVLKSQSNIESFSEFLNAKADEINNLVQKFSEIDVDNEDLYYDYGSDEKFSLKGRGPGECSAGVLDVIQLDLNNADAALADYDKSKVSSKLYDASVSAARALLVLNGVDSSKERVIFKEFDTHFIDTGLIKKEIKELINDLIDFKLGDIDSLHEQYEDVKYLATRVRKMFESLSPQLNITLEKEWHPEITEVEETSSESKENTSLNIVDFKGVKCPINFVKVKIELSKIPSGETIGFYLDDGEPIKNVPRSVEGEGHEIIEINENFEGYNLLVVKKK